MAQIRDISKRTALYERLSKDDEQQGESNSILNQKQYLEEYAHRNGFVNIQHFTDDGYTGRNFNRPGFQEMLAEIENGKIGTVIVKDMSRFGRNYLQVGFYTEMMFPQKQVRFIAINNSVDSDKPQDNDFTPFLNIMNEWYAKDTSNKIKSIFLSRMNDGKRCSGSIPYGYNRLPGDKQTLVVDPVASKVVKHIFALAADGYNPPTIAKKLTEEEVLIPSAYTLQYHPEQCNRKSEWGCTRWNPTTVREILERQEYLGHTVLRKTIGTNFKTDARRSSTDEEKLIFKDTHEPIIEEPVWTRVQKELKCHKYSPDRGKYQLTCRLPGLVLDLLDKEEIKYRSEKRLLGYRNKGKRRLAGNANQPIIINIDDVADVIDVRAEDEFARVELLVSLKQELERLSPRELMIIRTYLDYPIEVVARKLKVRPNTISKARRKIARELRKKLV